MAEKKMVQFVSRRWRHRLFPWWAASRLDLQLVREGEVMNMTITQDELGRLCREISRLTAALHAVLAHPDFAYLTVTVEGEFDGLGEGWERCPEAYFAPGDEVWRLRRNNP